MQYSLVVILAVGHLAGFAALITLLETAQTQLSQGLSYEPGNRAGSVTGTNLFSVHMGNFSPVDRDEIQETKPK